MIIAVFGPWNIALSWVYIACFWVSDAQEQAIIDKQW